MKLKMEKLNPQQREAVMAISGPVLVVAGAGTGKTRTIAYRTALMLDRGIAPGNILGITFTNKAARSMRERISNLVGKETAGAITLCTIHSLCVKILREDIHRIGRGNDFSIFDASDQVSFVRSSLVDMGLDPAKNDPRALHFAISQIKNSAAPQGFIDRNPLVRELMGKYNAMLRKNNSVDFDDLLLLADTVLEKSEEALQKYRERFLYVMVDEYQDVNNVQYSLLKKLAGGHHNIYAVGDDDQSIYGWRGARITHILNFEKDFPGAKIIKLESNYRSTQQIIDAANSVILNNAGRRPKKLIAKRGPGFPAKVSAYPNDREEAAAVIEHIISEKHGTGLRYCDFAVLFRTNAQSRLFEEALISRGINYVLVGGTKFYERKEIKDMLSYMRLAANPQDNAAFERVVNYPARGLGSKSMELVYRFAADRGVPPVEALAMPELQGKLSDKAADGARTLVKVLSDFNAKASQGRIAQALMDLVSDIKIEKVIRNAYENANEAQKRFDNIQEMVSSVADYESSTARPRLDEYLENCALMTEDKEDGEDLKHDCVAMMTMHAAKGLEFPAVFVVGTEEGILPHERSAASHEEVEEERRLFYVGMTRAMKRLFVSWCAMRRKFGNAVECKPSRFLDEIDPKCMERDNEDLEELRESNRQVYRDIASSHLENIRKMLKGK